MSVATGATMASWATTVPAIHHTVRAGTVLRWSARNPQMP